MDSDKLMGNCGKKSTGKHFNKRVFILICFILALKMPMWLASMISDGGVIAMNGIGLLYGQIPYRDWWDFKPPGVFILNGLGAFLFGPTPLGIRIFELLWIILSVIVFDRIVRRIFKAPSFSLATFIFALLICSWDLVRYGNTITSWGILPWLLALDFWLTITLAGGDSFRYRYVAAFFLGMSLAGACAIRLSMLMPALVLTAALFFSRHTRKEIGLARTWFCLSLIILGAGTIITALALWLNNLGVLQEAVRWMRVTDIYLKSGWLSAFRGREGMIVLRNTSMAVIPLLLFLFASISSRSSVERYKFEGSLITRLLIILIGLKVALILSGGRFYNHYFMELVPETALLIAPLFLSLEDSFSQRKQFSFDLPQKLVLIGAGILLALQLLGSLIYFRQFLAYDTKTEMQFVEYVRQLTSQEKKYFSWWGFEPAMLHLKDLKQVCPLRIHWFLYDIHSVDRALAFNLQEIIARRLAREIPPIFILTEGRQSVSEIIQYAPDVLSVLKKLYVPDKCFANFWVWRRINIGQEE